MNSFESVWTIHVQINRIGCRPKHCRIVQLCLISIMIISRASLLKRAFTKSGLQATPNNAIRNFILTQSVRKHGSWTYRTAAEGVPLKIRIWGQACSGCKFSFNRNLIKILFGRYMPMMCFSPYTYCSYVVVGFLAFILGLWTYYWRVSISRSPSMDR